MNIRFSKGWKILAAAAVLAAAVWPAACRAWRIRPAPPVPPPPPADAPATFFVLTDLHAGAAPDDTPARLARAMRVVAGVEPGCAGAVWPEALAGRATDFAARGRPIGAPLGVVVLGDLCHWGGGFRLIGEGVQLAALRRDYLESPAFPWPFYLGLGNHDLNPSAPGIFRNWYRRQMWRLVEARHRGPRAPAPVEDFDPASRSCAWSWGPLRLVQLHRCAGDTRFGQADNLPWLRRQVAAADRDGRSLLVLQHYGFDAWSAREWWTDAERAALDAALDGGRVAAILHGHIHAFAVYSWAGRPVVALNNAADEIGEGNRDGPGSFLIVRAGEGRFDVLDCRGLDAAGAPVWGGAASFPLPSKKVASAGEGGHTSRLATPLEPEP